VRRQRIIAFIIVFVFLTILYNNNIAIAALDSVVHAFETDYLIIVQKAVERAAVNPLAANVIPIMIIPTMHDGDVLPMLLRSIDAPVRQFFFVWNSDDADLGVILRRLSEGVPGNAVVFAQNVENYGFSASINKGLEFARTSMAPEPSWYFVVNTDVQFTTGSLSNFAHRINQDPNRSSVGTYYSSRLGHEAFAVTKEAVQVAGTMDENFYPAYYEDIDWRWRMNLAGFSEVVVENCEIRHKVSTNLHRGGMHRHSMKRRGGIGLYYGASKWGRVIHTKLFTRFPHSNFTTPFNLPNVSVATWVLDPGRIRCIKTGVGVRHVNSDVCWYNGTRYLGAVVGQDVPLPLYLREPTPNGYET
jgi:hypothetical protein